MTEMLERMISAMHEAKQKRSATKEDVARAALEALREPTPEMVDAAVCGPRSENRTVETAITDTWSNMISAAMGEDDG